MNLKAFALVWPNDDRPLLFRTRELAEENMKWFMKNYKTDSNGRPLVTPYIVELSAKE